MLRCIRSLIRSPELWARSFKTSIPVAALASRDLRLNRPESLSLSASGEKLVVSNSRGRNIAIYSFCGEQPADLSLELTDLFADDRRFHFAHGAVFGNSDELVLALGEFSHSLTAIDTSGKQHDADQSPFLWTVSGPSNGLHNPADLALHPNGDWLAVTNREACGLCILRLGETRGYAPPERVNCIAISRLNSFGLAAPHGVAFTPDGRYMFVSHKRFRHSQTDTGMSAVSVFNAEGENPAEQHWAPVAIRHYPSAALHHIACHPHRDIVAVTNSTGDIEVLDWDRDSHVLEAIASIDVFRIGEGVKGISFVKNGQYLVVSTELNEFLFFEWKAHVSS